MTTTTPFKVSSSRYHVVCVKKGKVPAYNARLTFDIDLVEHAGDDNWFEKAMADIRSSLAAKLSLDSGLIG